ncbi:MAG: glycosyltransferase family 2 protein [Deltaproteobacteria bacterium]|nr:glycosyltransferase family 2 protein [Candidatus Zymogenaceae bacterium]
MPVYSFVIICYNNRTLIGDCIESIYRHVTDGDFEIFVSDNGSTDGSVEYIGETFPEVIIVENGRNLGFARANNAALRRASGEYYVLLNSDARLTAGAVAAIRDYMRSHMDVGVAGGALVHEDGSPQNSVAAYPSMMTEIGAKFLLKALFPRKYPGKLHRYVAVIDVDSIIGACMVVRGSAVKDVGMLDEDYFFFIEETDWCYRMKRAGYRVVAVPGATIVHLQGKTAGRYPVRVRIEYYRSLFLFMDKHRGRMYRALFILGIFIKNIVNLVANASVVCVTLGKNRRAVEKVRRSARITEWLLKGRPDDWGLEGIGTAQ